MESVQFCIVKSLFLNVIIIYLTQYCVSTRVSAHWTAVRRNTEEGVQERRGCGVCTPQPANLKAEYFAELALLFPQNEG